MRIFTAISALSLCFFFSPVLSQSVDLRTRFRELNLDAFAEHLSANSPYIYELVAKRNDVTVWAPGNAAVKRFLDQFPNRKLARRDVRNSSDAGQFTVDPTPPTDFILPGRKRQVDVNPTPGGFFSDSNFEKLFTLLNDPEYVNLGRGDQVARFTRNYASPTDGGVNSLAPIEIVSGLGDTRMTLRGPYKFENGIIYEVTDFNTLPQPFTVTMKHLKNAQTFFDAIVTAKDIPFFEDTPAITVFAPVDGSFSKGCKFDPESYVLWKDGGLGMWMTADLLPGRTLTTKSGAKISITRGDKNERLVNGRRLVKPNVVTKNGVIHYIDGPLHDQSGCNSTVKTTTTGVPPAPVQTSESSPPNYVSFKALAVAFGVALMAFW